jgi:hypothetical protein
MRSIRSEEPRRGKFIDFRKIVLRIIFWFTFEITFNPSNNNKHTLMGQIHFIENHFTENTFHRIRTFYEMNVRHFINNMC